MKHNNIDNTNDDNELLCHCGLCNFVRYISHAITFNNYVCFIVLSALIEIYSGQSLTNFIYFTIGYVHLIYILRLLKYKMLSNIVFMILLPTYYKLSISHISISFENTFDLHNQCIKFIIIMQAICFIIKFIMFINKLLTIPRNELLYTMMYNTIL